jgi:hypothetical protein
MHLVTVRDSEPLICYDGLLSLLSVMTGANEPVVAVFGADKVSCCPFMEIKEANVDSTVIE